MNISGQDWLDPSTCRVMFDFHNLAMKQAIAFVQVEDFGHSSAGRGFWQVFNIWKTSICIIVRIRCSTYSAHHRADRTITHKASAITGITRKATYMCMVDGKYVFSIIGAYCAATVKRGPQSTKVCPYQVHAINDRAVSGC